MALFGTKKEQKPLSKKSSAQENAVSSKGPRVPVATGSDYLGILSSPRITEKATRVAEHNVYTFNVSDRATKPEIVKALTLLYKVTPLKVRIVVNRPKAIVYRGKRGQKGGGKKAYVTLKKGESIELL